MVATPTGETVDYCSGANQQSEAEFQERTNERLTSRHLEAVSDFISTQQQYSPPPAPAHIAHSRCTGLWTANKCAVVLVRYQSKISAEHCT